MTDQILKKIQEVTLLDKYKDFFGLITRWKDFDGYTTYYYKFTPLDKENSIDLAIRHEDLLERVKGLNDKEGGSEGHG